MKEFVETEGEGRVCLLLSFACLVLLLCICLFVHSFVHSNVVFLHSSFIPLIICLTFVHFFVYPFFPILFISSFFQLSASFVLDIVCSSTVKGIMS